MIRDERIAVGADRGFPARAQGACGGTAENHHKFLNGFHGRCAAGRARATFPSATESARACTGGSCAGLNRGMRIFRELARNRKDQYLMINSTLVRADQQAATGRKRGAVGALGIARGGLSINIHSLAGERVCHAPAAYRYGLGLQSLQFIDLGYLLVPSGTIHLYQGARDHLLLLL